MSAWNRWLKERDQAPLDQLGALLRSKFEETKEWLRGICLEDEDGPSGQASPNSLSGPAHDQGADQKLPERPAIACSSDYEGLDQTASNPPSVRPLQQQRQRRPTYSTIPLPGEHHLNPQFKARPSADCPERASAQNCEGQSPRLLCGDDRGLEARSSPVGDSKPPPLQDPFESASGPSMALMAQDWSCALQKGERVEVWSNSKQAWFEGVVLERCENNIEDNGIKMPQGSYRVQYSENTTKWVHPDHLQQLLRPGGRECGM